MASQVVPDHVKVQLKYTHFKNNSPIKDPSLHEL